MSWDPLFQWMVDRKRTDEEAYFAELLIPIGLSAWRVAHNVTIDHDWPAERAAEAAMKKARKLNPAHRERLNRAEAERAAEGLMSAKYLHFSCREDRPLRDISGLRFLPHIENLSCSQTEITDWTPLSSLTNLQSLTIFDSEAEDLRPLSHCTALRYLFLSAWQPWPIFENLENLTQLEHLHWHVNFLSIEGVRRLERVNTVHLGSPINLPLRNATRLPEMPVLRSLEIDDIQRLDGLERYATIQHLKLRGRFSNLRPLASLTNLTHLELWSDHLDDLSPLAGLPELRWLSIRTERPLDVYSLTSSPKLHEVVLKGCEANERELPILNAALRPWDEEFLSPEPRPLPPLRFTTRPKDWHQSEEAKAQVQANLREAAQNLKLRETENKWQSQRIDAVVRKMFPDVEFDPITGPHLHLYDMEFAIKLPELIDAVRRVMATFRRPIELSLIVRTEGRMIDVSMFRSGPRTEADEIEEERQDRERRKREEIERSKFLEAEARLRVQRLKGGPVNPADFAVQPEETPSEEPPDDDDDDINDFLHEPVEHVAIWGAFTESTVYINDKPEFVRDAEKLMRRKIDPA